MDRKVLFLSKIGQFLDLIFKFFHNFWLKLIPSLFFWPKKSLFLNWSLKLVNFLTLFSNFSQSLPKKKLILCLNSAPACFLAQEVLFCFKKNLSISGPSSHIFSQFLAKKILYFCLSSAPACFFCPKSLFFFKLVNFCPYTQFFWPYIFFFLIWKIG